jgi:hypothetical protein
MPGKSPTGLNQTERKRLVAGAGVSKSAGISSVERVLVLPSVVVEVVVLLCVRDTRIYPISG